MLIESIWHSWSIKQNFILVAILMIILKNRFFKLLWLISQIILLRLLKRLSFAMRRKTIHHSYFRFWLIGNPEFISCVWVKYVSRRYVLIRRLWMNIFSLIILTLMLNCWKIRNRSILTKWGLKLRFWSYLFLNPRKFNLSLLLWSVLEGLVKLAWKSWRFSWCNLI